jgi:small subunit ribosomal protein S2
MFDRWIPGSLTNGKSILGHGTLTVVDQLDRELEGFEEQLQDYSSAKPDLVLVLNPLENYPLLRECAQNNIPTVGVIDTNVNPSWVTYQIPANDDRYVVLIRVIGIKSLI